MFQHHGQLQVARQVNHRLEQKGDSRVHFTSGSGRDVVLKQDAQARVSKPIGWSAN